MAALRRMGRRLLISLKVEAMGAELSRQEILLDQEVGRLIDRGVGRDAALKLLNEGRVDELVESIGRLLAREVLSGVNEMAADSYWDSLIKTSEYWRWEWEPTAKHCDTCTERNGQVGTTEEMAAAGTPGAGTTDCSLGCRCRLVPITQEEYEAGEKITG